MKNKLLLMCCLFILGFGCGVGIRRINNNKTVAIRVSQPQKLIDYDLMSSINFISYHLKKQGYTVLGTSYAGNLYPPSLNRAKHNIFVRAFEPFYDVRIEKNTQNIFYVERFVRQYKEEFVGYSGYLTSQRNIQKEMFPAIKMHHLPSMAIPHPLLKPDYQYDVLYIYETLNPNYTAFLEQYIKNIKIYGGTAFANLTEPERQKELSKAKLVVYMVDNGIKDDSDFVPFAVYDIISYGRPILTNISPSLANDFNRNIFLITDLTDIANETLKALNTPPRIREERAKKARELLKAKNQDLPDFFN